MVKRCAFAAMLLWVANSTLAQSDAFPFGDPKLGKKVVEAK